MALPFGIGMKTDLFQSCGHCCAVLLCLASQLCLIFTTPVACQAHLSMWILQARVLEWVAMPFSRGSSNPGIKPRSPTLQVDSLPAEPQGSLRILEWVAYPFSRAIFQPRNQTGVSCTSGRFFTSWVATAEFSKFSEYRVQHFNSIIF